jgi:rhodanese-related sulfurtransferase
VERDRPITVEELLASARAGLSRLTPAEALAAAGSGATLVDIRPADQRRRDGELPGAHVIPRNVLEWRLDPRGPDRDPIVGRTGARVIIVCDQGFQSSLAAATARRLGIDATDVIGGVQRWLADGLPVEPASDGPAGAR